MRLKTLSARLWRLTLIALLCLGVLACGGSDPLPDAPPAELQTLGGETIRLQSLTGPVLVNFWSPNCAVCLEEMPAMASLYTEYAAAGFSLIAVAMPYDRPDQVLETARQRQFPFPVAIDISGEVLAQFSSVKGTPTSFLFDADGTGIARYVGEIDMPALRRQLDIMLSPASASARALASPPADT